MTEAMGEGCATLTHEHQFQWGPAEKLPGWTSLVVGLGVAVFVLIILTGIWASGGNVARRMMQKEAVAHGAATYVVTPDGTEFRWLDELEAL